MDLFIGYLRTLLYFSLLICCKSVFGYTLTSDTDVKISSSYPLNSFGQVRISDKAWSVQGAWSIAEFEITSDGYDLNKNYYLPASFYSSYVCSSNVSPKSSCAPKWAFSKDSSIVFGTIVGIFKWDLSGDNGPVLISSKNLEHYAGNINNESLILY